MPALFSSTRIPKDADTSTPLVAANGMANGPESAPSPASKMMADNAIGLFVMNAQSDEQSRDIFADRDKARIAKIERCGSMNRAVYFKTPEERDSILARLPDEFKMRVHDQEDPTKPLVRIYQPHESKSFTCSGGGAGTWGSSRGGTSSTGPGVQSGYRSAGGSTTSDSEGARRRGRCGGCGGGRGDGSRGGGRGCGGSRGGAAKGDGGSGSLAPAPATLAADS